MENKTGVQPEEVFDDSELAQQESILKGLSRAFDTAKNPTIPEEVFVKVFLPFFAQDEVQEHQVTLNDWFAAIDRGRGVEGTIGGQPHLSVDVLDLQGKVLFTVPPIIDHKAINANSEGDTSLKHVIMSFQQYNNIHPAQGKIYLETQLARRELIQRLPERMLTQLRQWDAIYKRYGRPTILREEETATTEQQQGADNNDDVVYSSF